MVLESVLGGVFGGLFRLAPEVLGFMDKKNERQHELRLGDQQYKVAELQFRSQQAIKSIEQDTVEFASTMAAMQESIRAQAAPTGIKWVDAFSAMIRPGVTVWIFVLYSLVKVAALSIAMEANSTAEALLSIWGAEDSSMLSAVLMFWFVGRVFQRNAK